jgi:outer membrane protein OmpA-like peptidoglycan-associated protein
MLSKAFLLAAATALVSVAHPGFAQSGDASTLTAEELQERFNNQRTRGLTLAPQTGAAAATAGAEDNAGTTVSAAAQDYVVVPESDQVAIQISFDFDSSALRADQKPKLATLCEVIKAMDEGVFRIVGHTDASGSASYNERLSLLRAQEVKRHLVGDCGIPDDRLEAVGVGESFPLEGQDPNADANRRVEFQALS